MASKFAPRRAPDHFVSVSPATWGELCALLGSRPDVAELRRDGALIGFHKWRVWSMDPSAYHELIGTWPPGYWPE